MIIFVGMVLMPRARKIPTIKSLEELVPKLTNRWLLQISLWIIYSDRKLRTGKDFVRWLSRSPCSE